MLGEFIVLSLSSFGLRVYAYLSGRQYSFGRVGRGGRARGGRGSEMLSLG